MVVIFPTLQTHGSTPWSLKLQWLKEIDMQALKSSVECVMNNSDVGHRSNVKFVFSRILAFWTVRECLNGLFELWSLLSLGAQSLSFSNFTWGWRRRRPEMHFFKDAPWHSRAVRVTSNEAIAHTKACVGVRFHLGLFPCGCSTQTEVPLWSFLVLRSASYSKSTNRRENTPIFTAHEQFPLI